MGDEPETTDHGRRPGAGLARYAATRCNWPTFPDWDNVTVYEKKPD